MEFAKWKDWATWYADFLDPLTPTPDRPELIVPPTNTPADRLDLTREARKVVAQLAVKDTDELHAVRREQVDKLCGTWNSTWKEICRGLEGLGYDVAGRLPSWC